MRCAYLAQAGAAGRTGLPAGGAEKNRCIAGGGGGHRSTIALVLHACSHEVILPSTAPPGHFYGKEEQGKSYETTSFRAQSR